MDLTGPVFFDCVKGHLRDPEKLVLSTGLVMLIGLHKKFLRLMFQMLSFGQSELSLKICNAIPSLHHSLAYPTRLGISLL